MSKEGDYFLSHNCPTFVGHVEHISNVSQNVGHVSCFLLKNQRGDPVNISYFCTFSYIFSLFFNSEIKKTEEYEGHISKVSSFLVLTFEYQRESLTFII